MASSDVRVGGVDNLIVKRRRCQERNKRHITWRKHIAPAPSPFRDGWSTEDAEAQLWERRLLAGWAAEPKTGALHYLAYRLSEAMQAYFEPSLQVGYRTVPYCLYLGDIDAIISQ